MPTFRLITQLVVLVVVGMAVTLGASNAAAAPCKKNINVKDVGDATSQQLRTAIVEVCSGGTIHLPAGAVIDLNLSSFQGELVIPAGKVLTILTTARNRFTSCTTNAPSVRRVSWRYGQGDTAV